MALNNNTGLLRLYIFNGAESLTFLLWSDWWVRIADFVVSNLVLILQLHQGRRRGKERGDRRGQGRNASPRGRVVILLKGACCCC